MECVNSFVVSVGACGQRVRSEHKIQFHVSESFMLRCQFGLGCGD